jgi:hypothetical protein
MPSISWSVMTLQWQMSMKDGVEGLRRMCGDKMPLKPDCQCQIITAVNAQAVVNGVLRVRANHFSKAGAGMGRAMR